MRKILLFVLTLVLISCNTEESLTADAIIEKAIAKSGGRKYENSAIEFSFRDRLYTSKRQNGMYEFTRTSVDSLGKVKDVLNNQGFKRYRAGQEVQLPDSLSTAFSESVNAVHYFVHLPYGLDGPAVNRSLFGRDSIGGKEYFEIEVSFEKEGGGKDHEDLYMYWIDTKDFSMDYLAYRYFVNGGGIRFRVGVNPRYVEGIRFLDYENYGSRELSVPLHELDDLYEQGKLPKISQIENEIHWVKTEGTNN